MVQLMCAPSSAQPACLHHQTNRHYRRILNLFDLDGTVAEIASVVRRTEARFRATHVQLTALNSAQDRIPAPSTPPPLTCGNVEILSKR